MRKSVLDRVVPGYYHRLNAKGVIERSTCCDNTATENLMMGKLMADSVELWATQYKIDSFRFDLMGHQPRAVMEQLQARADRATHRPAATVNLIGEGWNFGEVADGARFVQASQLSLNGSGIGTFSDRGAMPCVAAVPATAAPDDHAAGLYQRPGLRYQRAGRGRPLRRPPFNSRPAARLGPGQGRPGGIDPQLPADHRRRRTVALQDIVYGGNQPAGYASEPGEVVNYVENHDNQTLFDINVFKLPLTTTTRERAQVQMLGAAINAFSQGVAYYHAGFDILRSKSLDRNSFESGDWFNRLDWSTRTTTMAPACRRAKTTARTMPSSSRCCATPRDQAGAGRYRLRARRLPRPAGDPRQQHPVPPAHRGGHQAAPALLQHGPKQVPTVIVAHLDGTGYAGAGFKSITYVINVDKIAQRVTVPEEKNRRYQLHPVHTSMTAADKRVALEAKYEKSTGTFAIPPRSAVVFVEN
jgi:pullulanase